MIVKKNTYPEYEGVAHAKEGDVANWEYIKGAYSLIRKSDGKSLFRTPPVNKDGLLYSTGKSPVLVGVIGEVKSKGWVFELLP